MGHTLAQYEYSFEDVFYRHGILMEMFCYNAFFMNRFGLHHWAHFGTALLHLERLFLNFYAVYLCLFARA